jgi:hypothetical protein
MKKVMTIFGTIMIVSIVFTACDESNKKNKKENEDVELSLNDDENIDEELENISDDSESINNVELVDAFSYEKYTYDKKFTENERKKDIFDRRNRDKDEMIKVKFSDGYSGSIVYREGFWYNYTIQEKTEILFATKEDALQHAYDQSKLLQNAGASIATMLIKKSGPLKKDGTPDMRYKENQ